MYEGLVFLNVKYLVEVFFEKVEWIEVEGFLYGGIYKGVEVIMENVFSCLGLDWDDYKVSVNIYYEVNGKDVIVVEGMYFGVYKEIGKLFEVEFVYVW